MDTPIEQQRAIYGIPLAERFGAVMERYGFSQRRLAEVLGLSAPMLSQLSSGRRIKIGNPAVYERLVMLESRAEEQDLERVAMEVQASEPVLSTGTGQTLGGVAGERAVEEALAAAYARPATGGLEPIELLRKIASRPQLRAVADAARREGAAELATLLERAAAG